MNRLATKVVELTQQGTTEYLGNYDYYVEKKLELEELKALDAQQITKAVQSSPVSSTSQIDKEAKKLERQLLRQLDEVEQEMETLDQHIAAAEEQFSQPEIFQDHERLVPLQKELEALKNRHEEKMTVWLELQEKLEQVND